MTSATAAQGANEHPMMGPGRGRLAGKVAVITGANSGIGRAAARLFAREGAKVVCVDLAEVITPRIDALIQGDGGEAVFFQADVTSAESCQEMMALALERFGGLDILLNNAGTTARGRVDVLPLGDWERLIDVNLTSVFLCSKAALPHMMAQGRGSIVNTASTYGLLATENNPAYCASKAGVVMLTRSMAIDCGPMGIRVNCVCPGLTATPLLLGNLARRQVPIQEAAKMNRCLQRPASPEERSPTLCSSWPRTRPRSSPATPSPWTAARPSTLRTAAQRWKKELP